MCGPAGTQDIVARLRARGNGVMRDGRPPLRGRLSGDMPQTAPEGGCDANEGLTRTTERNSMAQANDSPTTTGAPATTPAALFPPPAYQQPLVIQVGSGFVPVIYHPSRQTPYLRL